jgi:hypothetical protein
MKPNYDAEAMRRRERTERGLSPAQRTTRSKNQGRAYKYPGKQERASHRRKEIASYGGY